MATGLGIPNIAEATARRQQQSETQALQELEQFRRKQTRDRSRSIGELAGDTGLALLSGAVGLGQAAYGIGNIASLGTLDRVTGGFSENFPETQQIIQGAQSAPLQLRREDAQAAMDESVLQGLQAYATDPSLLADLAVQAVPSLIPTVGAANLAARTVGAVGTRQAAQQAATRAAAGAAGAQVGGAVNVDALNTLREQGVEGLEQQALGVGAGLLAGTAGAALSRLTGAAGLEAAVGGRLAGLGGTGGGVIRGAAGGVLREGAEEAAQSATEQASINVVAPESTLGEGVAQAAALGGLTGGVLGGPLGGLAGAARAQQPGAQETEAPAGTTTEQDMFGRSAQWQELEQARQQVETAREQGQLTDAEAEELQLGLQMQQGELELDAAPPLDEGEQALFSLGEQMVQQELLLEQEDGGLTVNPDQQALFDEATQGMTPDQQQAMIQGIVNARQRAQEQGRLVQQQVQEATGVAQQAGITQDDLLTARQETAQRNREEREQVIAELFRVQQDEEGNATYSRYNPDIQAIEEVPRGVAVREANQEIERRREAEAEAQRPPSERWKEALTENLGLKKQVMNNRNKEWQSFAQAADEAGINPGTPEGEAFLVQQAQLLGADEAGAKRFAVALAERYSPEARQLSEMAEKTVAPQVASGQADVTPDVALFREGLTNHIQSLRDSGLQPNEDAAVDYMRAKVTEPTDVDNLERTWQAVVQTEEFQRLPEETQNDLVKRYSDRYDAIEPGRYMRVDPQDRTVVDARTAAQRAEGDPAAPTRAPTRRERRAERRRQRQQEATPLTQDRAVAMLADHPTVTAHPDVAAYKEATGRPAPVDAAGVYDLDGVHVILENVASEQQLAEVLAHEKAHQGMASLLGDRLPAVTNRLWANAAIRERIRQKMQNESLDRATAGEEVLADMVASNERLTGDVWSKIRAAVSSTFESILGVGSYRVTDRQVDTLLDDVARQMRGEGASIRATPLTQGEIPLDTLLGEPTPVTATQRFSRALDSLNGTVPQVTPAQGNHNQLSVATREATEATVNRFRDVWGSVKDGSLGRSLSPFLPLNQMYNLWGRNFDRVAKNDAGEVVNQFNPFRELTSLKGAQEAKRNQLVVRKRKLDFEGEAFEVSAHDIADDASNYQLTNPEGARALNKVLQESTRFQVWPNKPMAEQPKVNLDSLNLTAEERQAAWKELNTAYKSMGEQGQRLFKQIQAWYRDTQEARINALETELRRVNGGNLPSNTMLLELARRELNAGPYSPLSRIGKHLVVVRDSEGDTEWFSGHDSATEAEATRNALAKEFPAAEGFSTVRTVQDEGTHLTAGLNQEQLNVIEQALDSTVPPDTDPSVRQAIHDAMVETYLKMIPASSFGQFSNRRKYVSGYNMDGVRAFSDYALKASRQIASIEYDGQISNSLLGMSQHVREKQLDNQDTTIEQDVLNKVRAQHEAGMKQEFNALASMLSGAGFLYMMTSPSQLFVNATQTFIVALPRLAAQYGGAGALRVGSEALRNFFRGGRDFLSPRATESGAVDAGTQAVMQRLYDDGTLDFTLSHDLTDASNGESGQLRSGWRKTMQFMSSFIHKSEVFNRQVTAYMATKLHAERNGINLSAATDEQIDALYAAAKDAVDSTQFNYSQSNKPAVMQGPIRRLVFQFQQYRLNMLAMMAKDLRDAFGGNNATAEERALARRSLAYMLGSQLAFTGAVGTALAPVAFAIMDAFADEDDDFIDSRTAFIQAVPQWMAHGLMGGVLNLDPSRVEVGSVIPILGERNYAPTTDDFSETAAYYLEQNIGPWFGLVTGAIGGVRDAFSGDFYEAGQGLLPKPLSDVFRSIHEADGVRNRQGVITYDTGAWDSVTRALGLRSQDAASAQLQISAGYQASQRINMQRQNRLVELAVAHATGDREDYREAMTRIQEWNSVNPEFAVTGTDIGRVITSQSRTRRNVERTGLPLARDITPAFLEATGIRLQ